MKTIRTQLTLSYIGLAALIILTTFLLLGGLVRSYLLAEARASLLSRGQNMAHLLASEMVARGPRMRHDEGVQSWIRIAAAAADVDFIVLTPSGEPVAYSLSPAILEDPVALADETPFRSALESGEVQSGDWIGAAGDPMVAVFVPIVARAGEDIQGVVALFQPVGAVAEAANDLRNIVLQTSALALVLAIGAGLLLARRISRPAEELSDLARTLGRGELQHRSEGQYVGEFGQLAEQMDEMAEQLEELLRSRTLFAALISHEIRTPITTVRGFAQAIKDGVIEPGEQEPYLQTILEETHRIERLLGDLLQLERLEAGQLPLESDWIPVSDLLRDAAERLAPRARRRSVRVEISETSGDLEAWVDGERIAQVLGNLLDNALRHVPDGGRIQIAARPRGDEVVLTVSDDGPGFREDDMSRVFDRFYRASHSEGGVGLGLAISREIVERHGGSIRASNLPGGGARVEFRLPRIRNRPRHAN